MAHSPHDTELKEYVPSEAVLVEERYLAPVPPTS
jgi:hypothetical protein